MPAHFVLKLRTSKPDLIFGAPKISDTTVVVPYEVRQPEDIEGTAVFIKNGKTTILAIEDKVIVGQVADPDGGQISVRVWDNVGNASDFTVYLQGVRTSRPEVVPWERLPAIRGVLRGGTRVPVAQPLRIGRRRAGSRGR